MKNLNTLVTLALAFSFSITTAQTAPNKQWDARFGGSSYDELFSLQQTADGGYILGGYSQSGIGGDKTQASQGSADYWIVKTDNGGVKQWDARFGGSAIDILNSLQQTSDGGYILGGKSSSGISGDKTQVSQGGFDYWIVKTDADGVKQWDARFGGNGDDGLISIQQTPDGGYILGGFSSSGISGDKTQASQGSYDYWIVKTDGGGVKQWDTRFGGSSDDVLNSLQQTVDGGYVLGGYSYSGISGDKTQPSQGNYDYWIVKTDGGGVKQWDVRFGGSAEDILFSLKQTTDEGYILGGYSASGISGDKTQDNWTPYIFDYWIVKIDGGGAKQWDARFGGSDHDFFTSLQETADEGYILGGYSHSGISGDKTQDNLGGVDYWIVKTDAGGVKQWDAQFGGNSDDEFFALQQTPDEGYIFGGSSKSGISGDKTQESQGKEDYWIVKTDAGATTCPLPTSLYVTDLTTTSAKLNWDAVSGAIGYRVKYKAAGNSQWNLIPSTDNQESITGLLPNTQYRWLVKTICNNEPIIASDSAAKAKFITPLLRLEDEMVIPENFFTEIYPNPVQNQLTIKLPAPVSDVTIRVYDLQGKMIVLSTSIQNTQAQINTTALLSGFYTLQIINNKTGLSEVLKFVKHE